MSEDAKHPSLQTPSCPHIIPWSQITRRGLMQEQAVGSL